MSQSRDVRGYLLMLNEDYNIIFISFLASQELLYCLVVHSTTIAHQHRLYRNHISY